MTQKEPRCFIRFPPPQVPDIEEYWVAAATHKDKPSSTANIFAPFVNAIAADDSINGKTD